MNLMKFAVPAVACVASALMIGCGGGEVRVQETTPRAQVVVAAQPAPVATVVEQEGPPAPVEVKIAPPAERVEVIPVAPSAEYLWIKGHWRWNGATWIWINGHYVKRRVGWHWVPPHYEARAGIWIFIGGHWAR